MVSSAAINAVCPASSGTVSKQITFIVPAFRAPLALRMRLSPIAAPVTSVDTSPTLPRSSTSSISVKVRASYSASIVHCRCCSSGADVEFRSRRGLDVASHGASPLRVGRLATRRKLPPTQREKKNPPVGAGGRLQASRLGLGSVVELIAIRNDHTRARTNCRHWSYH